MRMRRRFLSPIPGKMATHSRSHWRLSGCGVLMDAQGIVRARCQARASRHRMTRPVQTLINCHDHVFWLSANYSVKTTQTDSLDSWACRIRRHAPATSMTQAPLHRHKRATQLHHSSRAESTKRVWKAKEWCRPCERVK